VESLAEKLRTEHLPLIDPVAPGTVLAADAGAPLLELHIAEVAGVRPGSLTCFVAGQPSTRVVWGDDGRVTVQAERSLPPGRSKYTCTAPHPHIERAYYWYTHLFMKPFGDGSWYSS